MRPIKLYKLVNKSLGFIGCYVKTSRRNVSSWIQQ